MMFGFWRQLCLLYLAVASAMYPVEGAEVFHADSFSTKTAAWFNPEVAALTRKVSSLKSELSRLPRLGEGVESSHFGIHLLAELPGREEITLDLGRDHTVDAVALVPACVPSFGPVRSYGFPKRFRILAAKSESPGVFRPIADSGPDEVPDPGRYPVHLRGDGQPARYVRIRIEEPSHDMAGVPIVALGEFVVLSGGLNVAVGATVAARSVSLNPLWDASYLVDGRSCAGIPLDGAVTAANGYMAERSETPHVEKWVQVDLGNAHKLNQIWIVPANPPDYPAFPGRGFPPNFILSLSDHPGMEDERVVFDTQNSPYPAPRFNAAIFPCETSGRYLRLTARELDLERPGRAMFAIGEIMAFSGSANVALGKTVTALDAFQFPARPWWRPEFATDGVAWGRRLVPFAAWIEGLSARREREREWADASARLAHETGATLDMLVAGMSVLIFAGLLFPGLLMIHQRRARRRDVEAVREQIARDLHDDIGSNLGGILLTSQVAQRRSSAGQSVDDEVSRIAELASGAAQGMKEIVLLTRDPDDRPETFFNRLREHVQTVCPEAEFQAPLDPGVHGALGLRRRRGIFLILKEALNNALRHSGASKIEVTLGGSQREFTVTIVDNGQGFTGNNILPGVGLASMRRRADEIGAGLDLDSPPGGGTRLLLRVPWQRSGLFHTLPRLRQRS